MSEQSMCEVVLSPEERRLLAAVLARHGVGADYLALRLRRKQAVQPAARPLPRWLLGRRPKPITTPASVAQTPILPGPARHCHDCRNLCEQPTGLFVCGVAVWTRLLQRQSLRTSARLRQLARTCPQHVPVSPAARPAVHHCRACAGLQRAVTPDERYVCRRGVWTNPMKPKSLANAKRLARLSAQCPHFSQSSGRWIPRS